MRSFTSSFERPTAADRPGVAQPVPVRDVPKKPWRAIFTTSLVVTAILLGFWERHARSLALLPGDLDDGPSAWAEQRRRADVEPAPVVVIGDSRILFDTNLDQFQALTGIRPIQLGLPGTNARPILENLADDQRFRGLVIVGIADTSYFREGVGLRKDALDRYNFESPAQHITFILGQALSRVLGFLDDSYRLSTLILRLDRGWRKGAQGPYYDVWKLSTVGDDRQTQMWSRIEHPSFLQAHARFVWLQPGFSFNGPPVTPAVIKMTLDRTRIAVAKIRARGGDVVFVRPPSAPTLRALEDKRLPRSRGWDALLKSANVKGIHADDLAAAKGLTLPEYSHLSAKCALVFTDAYVRELPTITARIQLRTNAPPPLRPASCAPKQAPLVAGGAPSTGTASDRVSN
jgi:hypothetical protein